MDGEDIKIVNFEEIKTMSFSMPISFRFFRKQEKPVDSWKQLYFLVMKELTRVNSDYFCPGHTECALPESEIGDLKKSKSMRTPMAIRRGIYIEVNLGTETILRRIRDALLLCQIPFEHLTILYRIDEARKEAQKERRQLAKQQPKIYTLDWNVLISFNGTTPVSYRYKSKRTRQMESWATTYKELLSDLHKEFPRKIRSGLAAEGRRSPDIVSSTKKNNFRRPQNIGDDLILETYGTADALIGRMYYFLNLCNVAPECVIIKFGFDNDEKEAQYLDNINCKNSSSDTEDVDMKILRRCRHLIKEYFQKGYRVDSWIDMNRLRSLYQSGYKEELKINDEQLLNTLLCISQPLGGRIYAQRTKEQGIILDEILQLIYDTFGAGATCIYIQMIYYRYQEPLSENFHLVSTDALGELIIMQLGRTYSLKKNGCLCYGRRTPDPEMEIIDEMKMYSLPVDISELFSKFWYIPSEKIQQILAGADEIIALGSGKYYYAPNLPIKKHDLNTMVQYLKQALTVQDKLTELDALNIILSVCPSLLEDVHFLNWNGFWKSMRYLLRDVITTDNCG